jgi:hypothetical protein
MLSNEYIQLEDNTQTRAMVNGLNAVHKGVEATIGYRWKNRVDFNFFGSLGNYQWQNDVEATLFSDSNVAVDTDSPVISWVLPTKSSSQLTYELELSDNPSFNNATTIRGLTNPFDLVSGLSNGRYYWRTRSVTADGKYSDYSQVAHFDVNSATAVGDNEIVPTEFALSQNYPNPFNPTTRISYQLAKDSYVTLKVYDLLGREVATLVNKNMKAGKYSVDFNASNLATGIYFYKLTAGDFNAVRKMILLK